MPKEPILELIATNREYLMLKSATALQNLAMLHKSFDALHDEECVMSLALNDSIASMVLHGDYVKAIALSYGILKSHPDSQHAYLLAFHRAVLGRSKTLLGEYADGRQSLSDALKECRRLKASPAAVLLTVDVLHDLAMTNDLAGGYAAQSAEYLEDALAILKRTSFEIRKAVCRMGLGNVRYSEGKVEEALAYYLQAQKIFDERYNFANLAAATCNVGVCYADMGRFGEAEKNLLRALELRERDGNAGELANNHYNLAKLYEKRGNAAYRLDHLIRCKNYLSRNTGTNLYKEVCEWLERLGHKE